MQETNSHLLSTFNNKENDLQKTLETMAYFIDSWCNADIYWVHRYMFLWSLETLSCDYDCAEALEGPPRLATLSSSDPPHPFFFSPDA